MLCSDIHRYFRTVASKNKPSGSRGSAEGKERPMCLLERREASVSPLNMTLAARLSPPLSKFPQELFCLTWRLGRGYMVTMNKRNIPFGSWFNIGN